MSRTKRVENRTDSLTSKCHFQIQPSSRNAWKRLLHRKSIRCFRYLGHVLFLDKSITKEGNVSDTPPSADTYLVQNTQGSWRNTTSEMILKRNESSSSPTSRKHSVNVSGLPRPNERRVLHSPHWARVGKRQSSNHGSGLHFIIKECASQTSSPPGVGSQDGADDRGPVIQDYLSSRPGFDGGTLTSFSTTVLIAGHGEDGNNTSLG
ncbi:hypothetical protein EDC04DRAFT_2603609 [Pisolithus marmoratus]|nr:hypothetical protein EDC04DRAFT_2603609 [Pisolithus marmoratus]